METDPVLNRRNDDREATHPHRYNTLRQKLQPPKKPETNAAGRAAIDPRKEISGGSNEQRMVRSKNSSHHHLPKLHGGKGLDERVSGGAIERGQKGSVSTWIVFNFVRNNYSGYLLSNVQIKLV